jgi:voltage-gated potassium channel
MMMDWRNKLYQTMFTTDTKAGKEFNFFLFIAILASVLVVILDSVDSVQANFYNHLKIAELFFTLVFSLEYIIRLLVSKNPLNYAFSFFGAVDLVSILPTYIHLLWPGLAPLLILRSLRLLRIFRILKLIHFWPEEEALVEALKKSFRKITVFLTVVLILVLIIGSLMYLIESSEAGFTSIPQSIYWTIVTITTVGYGDIAPQTALGKFLASTLMLIGYGIIAVPTGIVSADLSASNSSQKSPKTCPNCLNSNHDLDAKYCKYCSEALIIGKGS